ncbi:NuA4 histone H4 acetyltransferase complex and the SWR1 complex subunit [Physocladia obscura]|uniref:Protein AF-9 homolog n=1 Tax=Physocladia obscura TaxID=109957 RepID=A0AAD5XF36_9FUNG|nr:NuA4 histone H4 acetyltransferase complex and the SWR1 complex subunit [Physocladia obscura]
MQSTGNKTGTEIRQGVMNASVDLDDMVYNEELSEFRSACRCGGEYLITESQLEAEKNNMGAGGRVKGEMFSAPIVYGSVAIPFGPNDPVPKDESHTHKWCVFLRGANGEDLSPIIRKVTFKLHDSFVPPSRTVDAPPFEVHESGWGEFEILIKISFVDSQEKPMTLFHHLQLYPKEDNGIDPDMDSPRQTILSEHYDELVINEPYEEFLEPLRRYRLQVQAMKTKTPPLNFSPEVEANEIKRYYTINDKVMAELEKVKNRLAKIEADKRKLEADIKVLENESLT